VTNIPDHLKYTKEHEWVETLADGLVRFGITDYAQSALGDIVYIQLPKVGEEISAGKVCGEVESTKSVSEIFAPITGAITQVNEGLNQQPEIINRDPYAQGWLAEVKLASVGELMTPGEYRTLVGE
jgi:glycine cleavage system H protein